MIRTGRQTKLRATLLLCGVILAHAPAVAVQEQQDEPPAGEQGEQAVQELVVVRARPLESVAASVEVIDRAAIDAANVRSIAELLQYVAGARVLSSGSPGGLTTIEMRGGDPNFVLLLVDGVPLNDPTDVEGGAASLANLPASGVERIEVARGPLSYFYGSNGLSGVVNVVTRGGDSSPRVSATAEAGGNSLFRADASVAGGAERSAYFLSADWQQQDGDVGDGRFRQVQLLGNARMAPGSAADLRLNGRFASWRTDDYPESSGGPIYGSGELRHTEASEFSFGADLEWGPSEAWAHRGSAGYYRRDLDRDSPAVFPLVPAAVEQTTYEHLRASWLSAYEMSPASRIRGGIDLDHESGVNVSTLFLPPFLGGEVPGDYSLRRTTPGAYLEATTSSGSLALEGGIRVDAPPDSSAQWSPRIGARYDLGRGTSLRGTASRAFKLPSFSAVASPPALGGNPDLRPESSVGVDLGLNQRIDAWGLDTSLTVFWIRYEDLVDFDFEQFLHVNRDEVTARGVELSLRWRPDARWSILADLTYQDAQRIGTDKPLRNLPDWMGSLRAGYRPADRFHVQAELSFASETYDVQIAVPDMNRVPGYGVVDLAATWQAHESWQLLARVDNLTDTDYQHFIGFPLPGIVARVGVRLTLR